ncbi:MAG: hypothetical protein KBD50_03690 [Candidatus Pacebacteria bacterium]|nr:hypothetical protein [Candidatus Paceibacterota bacterium]
MQPRTLMWILVLVGSTVGGYLPMLWGQGLFSGASLFLSLAGAAVGLWLGFYIAKNY